MSRRSTRELALKVLFQVDVGRADPARALAYTARQQQLGVSDGAAARELTPDDISFAGELVRGALDHLTEIDKTISDRAREWRLERMANIDRNVLRLALYEMTYRDDIPVSVSINEAVELAKKFGTEDSGRFVNGILGTVARGLKAEDEGEGRGGGDVDG
ncbi:MAG: transcription antitermination factor NusB [Bacillota bacterium]